jgi:hypothetical protein
VSNLGSLYWAQGRYEDSAPLAEQVLQVDLRRFGQDHPDTLKSMHNLATTYDVLGRFDEAESMFLTCIATKRRVLGSARPQTIRSQLRLAESCLKQQRFSEAESLSLATFNAVARLRCLGGSQTRWVMHWRRVRQGPAVAETAVGRSENVVTDVAAAEWVKQISVRTGFKTSGSVGRTAPPTFDRARSTPMLPIVPVAERRDPRIMPVATGLATRSGHRLQGLDGANSAAVWS